jgi:protein-tyrosine phosphatase
MKLLLVCLGNICRSPMAEGALRHRITGSALAGRVGLDSAGIGDWHAGNPPDHRAIACARSHGVDITDLRARRLRTDDFQKFDWLLCADAANVRDARRLAPAGAADKVALYLDWAGLEAAGEIADPYTGGPAEFEHAWRQVDMAAQAAVERLLRAADCGIIAR